jgi:hypothetical protein
VVLPQYDLTQVVATVSKQSQSKVKARGLTMPPSLPILDANRTAKAMTSNHSKLGPREKGRKSKGKRKPQAAKAARARRTCLLVKLGVK